VGKAHTRPACQREFPFYTSLRQFRVQLTQALLLLPAGWCVFFCGTTYTFFWAGDHWGRIKKTRLYKILLGTQAFFLLALALSLL
jgi:hypothetical protein